MLDLDDLGPHDAFESVKHGTGSESLQRARPFGSVAQTHRIVVPVREPEPQDQASRRLEAQRIDEFLAQQSHGGRTQDDNPLLVQADDALIRPKIEKLGEVEVFEVHGFGNSAALSRQPVGSILSDFLVRLTSSLPARADIRTGRTRASSSLPARPKEGDDAVLAVQHLVYLVVDALGVRSENLSQRHGTMVPGSVLRCCRRVCTERGLTEAAGSLSSAVARSVIAKGRAPSCALRCCAAFKRRRRGHCAGPQKRQLVSAVPKRGHRLSPQGTSLAVFAVVVACVAGTT